MRIPKPDMAPPAPAGFHRANLQGLVDLGMQPSAKFAPRHELLMIFQLADVEKDGRRGEISARPTLAIGKKAKLRKWLESWRGAPFTTEDEAYNFDLSKLLGKPVFVQVMHKPSGDRIYADVTALAPIPTGMDKPTLQGDPIMYDPSADDADFVLRNLPEWVQKKIANALPPAAAGAVEDDAGGADESDIPF